MKLNKSKSGISLIVLVITIIVMIILATAIILSLNSSNITGKANEAKQASDRANLLEAVSVVYAEYDLKTKTGKLDPDTISAEEYVKSNLKSQGFKQEQLNDLCILDDGTVQFLPTIPKGFVASIYEDERNISEGFVIYETNSLEGVSQETAKTSYNQFVWIPVDELKSMTNESIGEYEPFDISGYPTEVEEYEAMKSAVEKHGGFYIGRYEAGQENGKTVSKKGITPYINIIWGAYLNSIGTSGAAYLAQNMNFKDKSDIVSTLCYDTQWEATCDFIAKSNPQYITNPTGKGNVSGSYISTGANEAYKACNVYDMIGNAREWTMKMSQGGRALRGGGFYGGTGVKDNTSEFPNGIADGTTGFRVAIYMK